MNNSLRTPEQTVEVPTETVTLPAILGVPDGAVGTVLFAHGSGSGRFSPRNNAVAHALQGARLATVLADLLTEEEAADRRLVFDIGLLADRLRACTAWVRQDSRTARLPVGYFGASTGAGAALVAAAEDRPAGFRQGGDTVRAVVSRGGRPDLASDQLARVQSPTLLIVGGADTAVIPLNEAALSRLQSPKQLAIVPGATHLFEEPGTLEEVSRLAVDWFLRYFPG